MKILSVAQIRNWDDYTIENEPVLSIDLMERAAQSCTNWIVNRYAVAPIHIFCGNGNNGGDGLAIARQLMKHHLMPVVYVLDNRNEGTSDFKTNYQRLTETGCIIQSLVTEDDFPVLLEDCLIIECLFGTGLSRPLTGLAAALVKYINRCKAHIIAIDVPCGMFGDESSAGNVVINAHNTLTFQVPKLAFLLPENQSATGEVTVLDIGLHPGYLSTANCPFQLTTPTILRTILKQRNKFSHKGTFGHALIIAGSKGKMGAAVLCAKACLATGAGLVTAAVPEWGMVVMQIAFAEAMALPFEQLDDVQWNNYDCVGIGPGLGTDTTARALFEKTLAAYSKPMVIDADALNLLALHPQLLSAIPAGSVLTPHPKEFERLFGKAENDFEKLTNATKAAARYQIYLVLKGHHTFIACPTGHGFFNSTGNAGMATAGSGDVLTGMLTGLLCQGYSGQDAAVAGVFLHGTAGDLCEKATGQQALTAGDLVTHIGPAYLSFQGIRG